MCIACVILGTTKGEFNIDAVRTKIESALQQVVVAILTALCEAQSRKTHWN